MRSYRWTGIGCAAAVLALSGGASAIEVTATDDPDTIRETLVRPDTGIDLSSVTITIRSHQLGEEDSGRPGAVSIGTFTNSAGTYGIQPGVVMSSGDVRDYGTGSNSSEEQSTGYAESASDEQEALLDPITGGSFDHFDVTQIDISFDMESGFSEVFFNVVWGTDEFPEFTDTPFIDAFGMFINGTNIAFVDGDPINVNHPLVDAVSGTELDGLLTGGAGPDQVIHTFTANVNPTGNLLTFILADSGDDIFDATAYIAQLGGTAPPDDPGNETIIPEPASAGLLTLGVLGLLLRRRRLES